MTKEKKYFAHKSAFIDDKAVIGKGSKVWHNVHVTDSAVIGQNCNIGQNCYVAGKMGQGCKLQNNVNLYDGVEIEDYVFCGPSMTFTNDLNPRVEFPKHGDYVKTRVETGATIGANCTIVCGITIGKYALIGAGSVVTKDVPPYALVYGNPARRHGWVNKQGEKVENQPKD